MTKDKIDEKGKALMKKCEKVVAQEESYCHTELVFCFGDKPAEWIKKVDERLQIATLAAVKKVTAIDEKERTWDKVVAEFQNLPMLQSIPEEDTHNEKSFSTEHESMLNMRQSHDEVTAKKIIAWFKELISDEVVIKATPIDINQLAALLARVGTKFGFRFSSKEVTKKNIVDIGVLSFPDLHDPYIKLYRIEVMLVVENKLSIVVHATDRGIICGSYHCRKYKPNAELIELVPEEARKVAIAAANEMFMNWY